MRIVWNALGLGVLGAPLLGAAYWLWYRLSPPNRRTGHPAGVVVLVAGLFVSAVCATVGALLYVALA